MTLNTCICGGVAAHSIHLDFFAHISPHADADDYSLHEGALRRVLRIVADRSSEIGLLSPATPLRVSTVP